jgi:hypothetical protein
MLSTTLELQCFWGKIEKIVAITETVNNDLHQDASPMTTFMVARNQNVDAISARIHFRPCILDSVQILINGSPPPLRDVKVLVVIRFIFWFFLALNLFINLSAFQSGMC